MMQRDGDLGDSLEKKAGFAGARAPRVFELLVRVKIAASVEETDSVGEVEIALVVTNYDMFQTCVPRGFRVNSTIDVPETIYPIMEFGISRQ